MPPENTANFDQLDELIQQRQWQAALVLAKQLHREKHDQAMAHFHVHGYWFYLAWKQHNLAMMMGQILPLLFALPVSWLHKGFGIAIRAHKHQAD
jgi:hypothetical protein